MAHNLQNNVGNLLENNVKGNNTLVTISYLGLKIKNTDQFVKIG